MERQTRNDSIAAVVLLTGAALIAVGSTQPWARASTDLLASFGRHPGVGFGFGAVIDHDGQLIDTRPFLIGAAALLAGTAVALFLTRNRLLDFVWRVLGLSAAVGVGWFCAVIWQGVADPPAAVRLAEAVGVGEFGAARGLWLVTIGAGCAAVGALIPPMRRPRRDAAAQAQRGSPGGAEPVGAPARPGWYVDAADPAVVQWFDGRRWTGETRPRA